MTIQNENYLNIQGWMVAELKLKGNELLIYAIIYGFTQAPSQRYKGGLQYLADWTNSTKQGVIKSLKSLINKGYIEKEETIINNVKFCEYYATKFNGVLNKVKQGIKQSLMGGIKQSLTNNTNINNNKNNKDNKNPSNNFNKDPEEAAPAATDAAEEDLTRQQEIEELERLKALRRAKKGVILNEAILQQAS